jgi:DNA-binding CsgD family transcriptional regulator
MAVYTSYHMIRDCAAGKAQGWIYLVENFAPAIRTIVEHYRGSKDTVHELLGRMRREGTCGHIEPCHQREFLFHLRPLILEMTPVGKPATECDVEAVTAALTPLTATEKQMAWLETFGYPVAQTAVMMRLSPETAAKLRERVAELLRGALDSWSKEMLAENGRQLGAALEAQPPAEPLKFRDFTDVIDGRITWQNRLAFERALDASWHEVHKACRIREADGALSSAKPLNAAEADEYLAALGVERPKPGFWKSLLAAR